MFADLDYCIKCTACLSQCPVGLVNPAFDGPKRLGPDLARLAGAAADYYPPSLKLCSNCRNCDIACPHGVNVSRLINLARGARREREPRRLRDRLLANVELSGKLINISPLNALPAFVATRKPLQRLAEKIFGLSPAAGFFRGGGYGPAVFSGVRQRPASKQVVYFPGCFASYFEPRVGLAAIGILNHFGYHVELPQVHCCGLPFLANGFPAPARARAEHNLRRLVEFTGQGHDIVTTCPSCGLMLQKEYRELFELERSAEVSGHVYDLFEFLEQAGVDFTGLKAAGRFAYHPPCHLRATGGGMPAYTLLARLPGMEVINLDAGCCGLSGSYGFKAENYPAAMAVGERVFAAVRATRPDRVLTECGTCRIQIALGTGLPVEHPACLLEEMLDRDPV